MRWSRYRGALTKLQLFVGVHLHAGTHGGSGHAGLDILALGSGGLGLDDSADEGGIVLKQLVSAEGHLADGAVDDVGLVQTILDLTGLRLLNSLGGVVGDNSTSLSSQAAKRAMDVNNPNKE